MPGNVGWIYKDTISAYDNKPTLVILAQKPYFCPSLTRSYADLRRIHKDSAIVVDADKNGVQIRQK